MNPDPETPQEAPQEIDIELPLAREIELRKLAAEKGMSLDDYLSLHLKQSIVDGSMAQWFKDREDEGPALSS